MCWRKRACAITAALAVAPSSDVPPVPAVVGDDEWDLQATESRVKSKALALLTRTHNPHEML